MGSAQGLIAEFVRVSDLQDPARNHRSTVQMRHGRWHWGHLRFDVEAGFATAVLAIPQAIALATLAGMPPEYGIYASIFPALLSAFFGSSAHVVTGPNTALCILIGASVAPLAGVGTDVYIDYVLILTLMAGAMQLAIGLARVGTFLDFISQTVIDALIVAVAIMIAVAAGGAFLGIEGNAEETFGVRVYQLVHDITRANPYAILVGVATFIAGIVARKWWRRFSLLIAVVFGTVTCFLMNLLLGSATTEVALLGHVDVKLLPLHFPTFSVESAGVLKSLALSAFSVALLGLMTTVVVARAIAAKSGAVVNTQQEIISQGIVNLAAPFLSSFASCGSVNRSIAHFDAGAKTSWALVFGCVWLLILVIAAEPLLAMLPMPAVAGSLLLVATSMVERRVWRRFLEPSRETGIFVVTLFLTLTLGLNTGILCGLALSIVFYFVQSATPRLTIGEYAGRDGRPVKSITIVGDVFFGSARFIEKSLAELRREGDQFPVFLINVDNVNHIDASGVALLAAEAERLRARGGDLFLVCSRPVNALVINTGEIFDTLDRRHLVDLYALGKRLTREPVFQNLRPEQILTVLRAAEIRSASKGMTMVAPVRTTLDYLVVLKGSVGVTKSWNDETGNSRAARWRVDVQDYIEQVAVVNLSLLHLDVIAEDDVLYLLLDGLLVDEFLSWNQFFQRTLASHAKVRERMNLVRNVIVFRALPLENVVTAFEEFEEVSYAAQDTLVEQGERGDYYFLIESGEAETWRRNPVHNKSVRLTRLGAGDDFGEEALLRDGVRNATVKALTALRVLRLKKARFKSLASRVTARPLAPYEALAMAATGDARWLDCRWPDEFSDHHIPHALSIPADAISHRLAELDRRYAYIVYCQTGRRAEAVASELKGRGLRAYVLAGGLQTWPYAIEFRAQYTIDQNMEKISS